LGALDVKGGVSGKILKCPMLVLRYPKSVADNIMLVIFRPFSVNTQIGPTLELDCNDDMYPEDCFTRIKELYWIFGILL
jgi:hypothetical protein